MTRGTATSNIQPAVSNPAAMVSRPGNQRVSSRINGQLANASTAAQNSADQNGAKTQIQALSNPRRRICTNKRSLFSIAYGTYARGRQQATEESRRRPS